ncbi:hypothetical protein HNO88_002772 [Novosphingobium chloroacetimidivorans]|uniref:Uncharacterized protein n=1 Tax=Novosphingobium chloroacetimidivorans TaxID=1428314 RepID=A0A7W7KCA9_9SPHN|nr:hypothetical protein [Novosphingobium chloroacetimidivorans]MBB4859443.1 hypothetical protein [Novosphingobium chloroacetimidivorans]
MYFKNDHHELRFIDTGRDPEPVRKPSPRALMSEAYQTVIGIAQADPAMMAELQDWLMMDHIKPTKRKTHPMPLAPELIEVSIWDNWDNGKPVKGQPNRYGVNIKAWASAADVDFRKLDQVDWSGRVSLMPPADLRKVSKKAQQKKGAMKEGKWSPGQVYPISPEYAAMIETACVTMEVNALQGGLLVTKIYGEGTLRHEKQMMLVDTAAVTAGDTNATAVIWVDDETPIQLPAWSTCDAAGKPLPESYNDKNGKHAKCVMQCRYALDTDRFRGWVTGT